MISWFIETVSIQVHLSSSRATTTVGKVKVALNLPPRVLRSLGIEPSYHYCINIFSLTNRFHVAMRLFSNRSQMMSKCGKNKKVAHEAIAECVTDVLTIF